MSQPLRILIAENYELLRMGLKLSLESKQIYNVVAEAENGFQVMDKVRQCCPDIILMELDLAGLSGIEVTRQIKKEFPGIKIILFAPLNEDYSCIGSALSAGANAFCLKDIKVDQLIQVINMVTADALWIDPRVNQIFTQLIVDKSQMKEESKAGLHKTNHHLTEREMDVLERLVQGKSNREIAESLCLSVHTVKIHITHIMQKLNVVDRTQIVIKALHEQLIKCGNSSQT